MNRQRKTAEPGKNENRRDSEKEPGIDRIERKNPIRHLTLNGAYFETYLSNDEYRKVLEEGELFEDFGIKRESIYSNPKVIGKIRVRGMEDIEIRLDIIGESFHASNTLRAAGVDEEVVVKVGQIEFAMQAGENEIVAELLGEKTFEDPGSALGGIEGAFVEKRKKDE